MKTIGKLIVVSTLFVIATGASQNPTQKKQSGSTVQVKNTTQETCCSMPPPPCDPICSLR